MSNSKSEYNISCVCTAGQGALLGKVFTISVPSTFNGFRLLEETVRVARTRNQNFPPGTSDKFILWKLQEPLSSQDLKSKSAVQKATNLQNLEDSSQSHVLIDELEPISSYWTPEELETKNRHVHLLLQVPITSTHKTTGAKTSSQDLIRTIQFKKIASLIAISVPQKHKTGADFRSKYLFESGPTNNNVSPAAEGEQQNSAILSEVGSIRELATEIMQGSLRMRPWPAIKTPESVLKELTKGKLEKSLEEASKAFKQSLNKVQDSDYVSFHLYFVILWLWDEGKVTEPKVHAFLTYILERNVLDIFSGNHLKVVSGQSFKWTMLLRKPPPQPNDPLHQDEEGHPLPGYEKWAPHPDFAILVDGFPFLVIEVCSDTTDESDRYRMLLYAASILRAPDAFFNLSSATRTSRRTNEFKPIIVACYIIYTVASVYILYPDDEKELEGGNAPSKRPVKFTRDDYDLSTKEGLFKFTRLLYLLVQYVMDKRNAWTGGDLGRWETVIDNINRYAKPLKTASQKGPNDK